MSQPVRAIIHPTDFSDVSNDALAHAMRIALAARCELHLLHIEPVGSPATLDEFPHVRHLLSAWGLMKETDAASSVRARFGVSITKCDMEATRPVQAIADYIEDHSADLLVLGTEGRSGWDYLRKGSMAERISREARKATLFVRSGARGFVDGSNGDLILNRILVPVDHETPWAAALNEAARLLEFLNPDGLEVHLLHVGQQAPVMLGAAGGSGIRLEQRTGPVVPGILAAAADLDVDLIVMPTRGHDGVLDALRGSVTERVLHLSPTPLLAIPAR